MNFVGVDIVHLSHFFSKLSLNCGKNTLAATEFVRHREARDLLQQNNLTRRQRRDINCSNVEFNVEKVTLWDRITGVPTTGDVIQITAYRALVFRLVSTKMM